MIDEEALAELTAQYSYRLKNFSEEDANDLIAQEFQEWAQQFLEETTQYPFQQYGDKVQIYFRFVEKDESHLNEEETHSLDAWVSPLYHTKQHSFVILVSISLLRGISEVFTAMALGPEVLLRGVTQNDLEKAFKSKIYPSIIAALIFVFFHELAHIVRAHIPFFYKDNYARRRASSPLSFHLLKTKPIYDDPSLKENKIRVHRSMEIDADLLAIGLIHEFLSSGDLHYSEKVLDNPFVFGEAVAIVTRLLEQWRRSISKEKYDPVNTFHPHPDIRYIFFYSWLFARKKLNDKESKFLDTTFEFERGFESANTKMDAFGSQFFPLFEYLEATGRDVALDEYEILRVDLDDYLRPLLRGFKC